MLCRPLSADRLNATVKSDMCAIHGWIPFDNFAYICRPLVVPWLTCGVKELKLTLGPVNLGYFNIQLLKAN